MPNERPGADAGWRVLFAFQRLWPRAAQAGRYLSPLMTFALGSVKSRKENYE